MVFDADAYDAAGTEACGHPITLCGVEEPLAAALSGCRVAVLCGIA